MAPVDSRESLYSLPGAARRLQFPIWTRPQLLVAKPMPAVVVAAARQRAPVDSKQSFAGPPLTPQELRKTWDGP